MDYHNSDSPDTCLGAGNQLGKTFAASRDAAYHMTGLYPRWWKGPRFKKAPKIWLCGVTAAAVRDSFQKLLLGEWEEGNEALGSGAVPRHLITKTTNKMGLPGAFETFTVKHVSGRTSKAKFMSYDQGRAKFQAATIDKIYFDEEPPQEIYSEGRTRTNKGQLGNYVSLTFTPLLGMTEVVMQFYQNPKPHQKLIQFTLQDATHYTQAEKDAIIAGYPDHEREARANGTPILGSGRIFPIPEEAIKEPHISEIPKHWRLINGLDFGWDHPQACAQVAYDADNDVIHVVRGVKLSKTIPIEMYANVKVWAKDAPTSWPHDGLQHDKGSGKSLADQYREAGFNMLHEHATHEAGGNGVEAAITEMLSRMRTGRLKIDDSLTDWFEEMRLYHRKDGKIVKLHDDLISATRYAIMMLRFADTITDTQMSSNDLNFVSDFG